MSSHLTPGMPYVLSITSESSRFLGCSRSVLVRTRPYRWYRMVSTFNEQLLGKAVLGQPMYPHADRQEVLMKWTIALYPAGAGERAQFFDVAAGG